MKLKLNKNIPKPAPKKEFKKIKDLGIKGPVGWWRVTTEGDCEGRTTRQCGDHYGHVVEIALSLTNNPYYRYHFHPITDRAAGKRVTRQAVRKEVWIQMDISMGTWSMSNEKRAEWMQEWLDCDEIECLPYGKNCVYYASTMIRLK